MQNFNTNQTRHFYVAGADKTGNSIANNLDIQVKKTATDELFFVYKNADGLLTRSDTIDIKKVKSLKKTAAADMARKLKQHTVAIDTNAVTLSALVGKTLDCIITINQIVDYDDASSYTFVASVVGDATNTANATAFHKALAYAIAQALPQYDKGYPLIRVFSNGSEVTKATAAADITGASAGVVLVEGEQKYVRGKLSGEPCPFSVAFRLADGNVGDIVWGSDTVANSAISGHTVIPGVYALADLEYFALGERGDMYRGGMWPNDYQTTYAIDLSKNYDVLTIEYFWNGDAENVQKSPRMIQIAGEISGSGSAATSPVQSLYDEVEALIAGTTGSGTGA